MNYNQIAEKYEKFNDITEWELGYNIVTKFLGDVKNKIILDYGCGNAKFSRYLRNIGAKCIAVDQSKKMIDIAKTYDNQNIDLRLIQDTDISFIESGSIDAAVINFVICVISDRNEIIKILKKIYRCLKINAYLLILEPNPKSIGSNFVSFRSKKPEYKRGKRYVVYLKKNSREFIKLFDYYWSLEDYTRMLKEVGFRKITFKEPTINKKNKKAKWIDEYKKPPYLIIKTIK
jgi:ubiquinone/menaquinone biosynthesis C-methylase UbiE